MSRPIIITADDYGLCDGINNAIEECIVVGSVRATCVMVNMPAYKAAGSLRKTFADASIGLHWTLTQGNPVLSAVQVPSLVDSDGQFLPFSEFRRRWIRGWIDRREVIAELRAQEQRFREVAGVPDFWNTHQNVHLTPGLFEISVSLGLQLGISTMRCHRRITVWRDGSAAEYNLRHPLYWAKGQAIAAWSSWAERRGAVMPAGLLDVPGFAGKVDVKQIVPKLLRDTRPGVVEIAIHPSTEVRPELFGAITGARVEEYRVFSDPTLKSRLASDGVNLVGFESLNRSGMLAVGHR